MSDLQKMGLGVFAGAPPNIKSAVMDAKGRIWLFECRKSHLTPNHRSWVSDIETAFYFHSGSNNADNWQDSAIDRSDIEIEAFNKEVERLMSRLGRAMKNETGTRFTAGEVQTLMLTSIGQSAAMCLHYSEEDRNA